MYRKGSPVKQRASRLKRDFPPPVPAPPPFVPPPLPQGVGGEIKRLLTSIGFSACGECGQKAKQWDMAGVSWCEQNSIALTLWLTDQAKRRKRTVQHIATALISNEPMLAAKMAAMKLLHPLTDIEEIAAKAIVDFAIQRAKANGAQKINGPVPAVVSVSPRDAECHRRTFSSIQAAGFSPIYATCEPGATIDDSFKVTKTLHAERRGQWRNFVEALKIGLATGSQYFMTMEDDVELCRGSQELLLRAGWPSANCGCLSLYSAMPMRVYSAGRRSPLNLSHATDFLGACALVFRRESADKLLAWATEKGWRGDTASNIDDPAEKKAADTFVGEVLSFYRLAIWTHNPSIANHIGDVSTMGHHFNPSPNRKTLNFPGIDADLTNIFSEELKIGCAS